MDSTAKTKFLFWKSKAFEKKHASFSFSKLYLGAIHKQRRSIFPNLKPPSLPLSAQVTK